MLTEFHVDCMTDKIIQFHRSNNCAYWHVVTKNVSKKLCFPTLYQCQRIHLDHHRYASSVASKIGRTLGIYRTYTVDDHYATLCVVLSCGDHLSHCSQDHTLFSRFTRCFVMSPVVTIAQYQSQMSQSKSYLTSGGDSS